MFNLLSANRILLVKSKPLWLGLLATVGYSIFLLTMNYIEKVTCIGHSIVQLNWYLLSLFSTVSMFCPIFCGMFIGAEYGNGTMRNRLIVGYSRKKIYLANFITVVCVNLGLVFISSVVTVILGVMMFGWHLGEPMRFFWNYLSGMLTLASFGGFFTMLSMLIHDKSISIVTNGATFFASFILESIVQRLVFSYYNGEAISDVFSFLSSDRVPLPALEFLYDFVPMGQCLQLAHGIILHPLRLPAFSILFTGATVLLGVLIYQKQNLK